MINRSKAILAIISTEFTLFAPALFARPMPPKVPVYKYLVPSGYTGWLVIEYGIKGAPPTPTLSGATIYKFPSNGRLKTSSHFKSGEVHIEKYYFVTVHGLTPIATDWPGKHSDTTTLVRGDGGALEAQPSLPSITYQFIGTKKAYVAAEAGTEPKSEEQEARDKAIAFGRTTFAKMNDQKAKYK